MSTPLSTTDPAELANLARCWSACLPVGLQLPLRNFQLTNIAVVATNPVCSTPASPFLAGVFDIDNTSIQITWKANAHNTGSFITGWIISWGTISGGPYTSNSGVLPLTPRFYIASGLNSGTTYYFVVTAVTAIAGCTSAPSHEASATTTGSPSACASGTTFASAWANRVVANGGAAPSAATQLAIANFQCGLVTDGLDTQMLSWNTFAADNLIAAITPQLLSVGTDPWTNHGFVLADLTVNGLIGDGVGKWLGTGIQPQDNAFWGAGAQQNSTGVTAYVTTNTNPAAGEVITGNSAGGASLFDLEMFNGNTNTFMWDAPSSISVANAGFTGYVSANRTAANVFSLYEANSGIPHHLLGSSAVNNTGVMTVPPFKIPVFAFTNNAGTSLFSTHRLGFIGYHLGLSAAQSLLFSARVQTLMSALGRAI